MDSSLKSLESSFNGKSGPVLSTLFSASVLREFSKHGHSITATRIIQQNNLTNYFPGNTRLSELYNCVFDYLARNYRNEYVYKNAIAEKILLGKHNLNTSFMLFEFPVGSCKADAVVLNGTSHVYEIKSEFDNYSRLDSQIAAYMNVFEYITIITSQGLYDNLFMHLPKNIGIMVLAEDGYRFRTSPRREACSNIKNIKSSSIFDCLQRKEFLYVINNYCDNTLANCSNTEVYSLAKPIFSELPPEYAHKSMVEVLRKRRKVKHLSNYIQVSPRSLKAAMLSIRLNNNEYKSLLDIMNCTLETLVK